MKFSKGSDGMEQEKDMEQEEKNAAEEMTEEAAEDSTEDVISAEEKLKADLEELNLRYLRQVADFDNFRKRTAQEKEELARYSVGKFITELLPVLDNFERALGTAESNEAVKSYLTGLEMVYKQLAEALKKEGLEVIPAVGEKFDPNLHEAIMQVDGEDGMEEDTVVEELRKGYQFKGKVLRPTMCKVSR